jgi:hypothetical protein
VKNNGEEETREEICLWGKVFVKKRGNCTSFAKKVPREGVKLRSSSEKKSKKRKKSDITEKSVHAWGMHPNSRTPGTHPRISNDPLPDPVPDVAADLLIPEHLLQQEPHR